MLGYPNEVQRFNLCILTHLQRFPPAVDPSMLRGAVCITPYYVIAHLLLLRTQSVLVRALFLFPSFVVIIPTPCLVLNIERVTLHYRIMYVSSAGANPRSVPCRVTLMPTPIT